MLKTKYICAFSIDQINTLTTVACERKYELQRLHDSMKSNNPGRRGIQNKIIMINDALLALRDDDIELVDEE